MKKGFLIVAILSPLLLGSCGGLSSTSGSSVSSSTSSSSKGKNNLTSVLSSIGKNVTVNAAFISLSQGSTTPIINTTYVEEGCFFKFTGFTGMTNFGLVNVPDGKISGVAAGAYEWTLSGSNLVLGASVSTTPDFRSVYNDPSLIGTNSATFVDAFKAEIEGTTSGFFDLNKDKTHATELTALAKYLGIYDALSSISNLSLNYATLYFSDNGTSFTFHVYSTYENGFDALDTVVTLSKIGTTSVTAITNYLK